MLYHVTIERSLTRVQRQTISVEATDAKAAYDAAAPQLDPANWHTEPYEMVGEQVEVECVCDSGWEYSFRADRPAKV